MNAERLYRLLLRLYPNRFRQQYGEAMTDAFIDLHQHARGKGVSFWFFVASDTIRAAAVQHLDVWASEDRRVAARWLAACVVGTVLCNVAGGALLWAFRYLYHPFLEGMTFLPSVYGALLGATLGLTQSLMFGRVSERAIWIIVSALSAAVGWEFATEAAPVIGPLGYGVIIGATVATAQRLALRGRMRRPSAAAMISAFAVSTAAVAGSVAVTRSLAGLNALGVPHGAAPITVEMVLRGFYMPMDWRQCLVGIGSTAIAGLLLGAITVRPASSLLARAHYSEI
jgi:hypothetical protein